MNETDYTERLHTLRLQADRQLKRLLRAARALGKLQETMRRLHKRWKSQEHEKSTPAKTSAKDAYHAARKANLKAHAEDIAKLPPPRG